MAATITGIADAVVTKIAAFWTPTGNDAVSRVYLPDVTRPEDLAGRKVYVWPVDYGQSDIATRAQDRNKFTVGVEVVERFASASNRGTPTRSWCDTRIDFVEDLWALLTNVRSELFPSPLDDVLAITGEITLAFDPDLLREKAVFWSSILLTYERDET